MDAIAEGLKTRTKRFVIEVLDFVDTLPHTPAGEMVARQLSRAGGGVAGNYRASCRSRSHAEFTARTGIVLEEADESELWLDVANEKQWGAARLRDRLLTESRELRAIFAKSYQTAKSKEPRRRN